MTINQFMTTDHRACDDQFAELENIVDQGNFEGAKVMFDEFKTHMLKHFDMEEKVMFPQFNNSGSGGCNPTGVMVMEHDQMRGLFDQMENALNQNNKEAFLGYSENLLFVMQQHNMKEEQIMYNLADDALNSQAIIEQMKEYNSLEIILDTRELEAPEPIEKVFKTLPSLDDDSYIKMIHRMEPKMLYNYLEQNGFLYKTVSNETDFYIYIWSSSFDATKILGI